MILVAQIITKTVGLRKQNRHKHQNKLFLQSNIFEMQAPNLSTIFHEQIKIQS